MNKLNRIAYPLVAVLSMVAAASAFAESPTPDDTATQVWNVTKTRYQVQAELAQARADGSIKVWSTSYNPLALARSTKSRDEVRAERDQGVASTWYGEDSGSFALSRQLPVQAARSVYASVTPR